MKVAYISHIYIVKQNQHKIELIRNKYNIETLIITPRKWKNILIKNFYGNDLKNSTVKYLEVYRPGNLKKYLYRNILPVLKHFKPDIIHIDEEPWFLSTFQIIFLSINFLKPPPKFVIFTWENINKKFKFYYHWIERYNLKKASVIFAGNKEAKKRILQINPCANVYVLPNLGVNLNEYNFKKKISSRIRIGYIGRLVPEKGIFLLLNAFLKLPVKNKFLSITGDGILKQKIKQFIETHKLTGIVKLNPPVPHEKVAELFKELDILVLPSYSTSAWKEQFGHVLIEAMAGKTAVLGSSCGAIPEVIDKAGLIFKENDENDLLKKLYKLVKDKNLREKLIEKGYKRVKKHYTNEVLAEKTVDTYNKIITGK